MLRCLNTIYLCSGIFIFICNESMQKTFLIFWCHKKNRPVLRKSKPVNFDVIDCTVDFVLIQHCSVCVIYAATHCTALNETMWNARENPTGETRPNHFKLLANSCRRSWWFKTSFLIFSAGQQLNTTWCRNKYKTIQVIIQKVLLNDQGGDTECRTMRLTISSGIFSSITIIETIVSPKAI